MKKNTSKVSASEAASIGAGVVAMSAGMYYLLGPKGKKHRKDVGTWMVDMKRGVSNDLKKAKAITEPIYHEIVDSMAETYGKKYKEYKPNINAFAKKLKNDWKNIEHKSRPVVRSIIKK